MQQADQRLDESRQAAIADAFLTVSRALVGLAVHSINAAPVDITVAQHRLLVLLAAHGPRTIGEIAGELRVNPSNATRHCDRLQRLGLVDRRRSPHDGRAVEVSLTTAGKELLDTVTALRREEVLRVLQVMPRDESEQLLKALATFSEAAHELSDSHWATHAW